MPYIITTITEGAGRIGALDTITRRAVATLDEAREYVHDTILTPCDAPLNAMAPFYPVEDSVPEQGGTVGPLPDGTVIEVIAFDADDYPGYDLEDPADLAIIAQEVSA